MRMRYSLPDQLRRLNDRTEWRRWKPELTALLHAALVVYAFTQTLRSLEPNDSPNNLLQIPLALPWFFLTLPVTWLLGWEVNYRTFAYFDAFWGLLNSVIIFLFLRRRRGGFPH